MSPRLGCPEEVKGHEGRGLDPGGIKPLEKAVVFWGSLLRLPSYLGDVLHGSTHWVPFCWVINDETLPKVTEQLPGEEQWVFVGAAALSSCPSSARSCLG